MLIKAHMPCDDCGSSDALAIYTDCTMCFSCKRRTNNSTHSLIEKVVKTKGMELTPILTKEAYVWLLKSRIYEADVKNCGIMYDNVSKRVMLPLRGEGNWQGRSLVDGDKCKYLTFGDKQLPIFGNRESNITILTEDWCSAYRVSQSGDCNSLALLGTSVKIDILLKLIPNKNHVMIWLDPDKAGRDASKKIYKQLSLYYTHLYVISSDKDPKMYSDIGIWQIITEAL